MTYKEKTIAACKELLKKYKRADIDKDTYGEFRTCPLCQIYRINDRTNALVLLGYFCPGCFMASKPPSTHCRCLTFASFKKVTKAVQKYRIDIDNLPDNRAEAKIALHERGAFYEKIIPMLEKIPAKYFTPSSWKFKVFDIFKKEW